MSCSRHSEENEFYSFTIMNGLNKIIGFFSWSVAVIMFSCDAHAQGCSDAGFCTAGAIQASDNKNESKFNAVGLGMNIANGEKKTAVLIPQLSYTRNLNQHSFLEIRLPYYIASGDLGNYSGIGDPIISYTNKFFGEKDFQLSFTGGIKIGLGKTNAITTKDHPLPMPYQPGLGTTDIILGLRADYKNFLSFAAGYQQPLFQYNNNGYLSAQYPDEPEAYKSFPDSRHLRRKGDALLRTDIHFDVRRFRITAGPLLIYHLGNDKATDLSGTQFEISGSKGITLNATAGLQYVNERVTLQLLAGAPVIARKSRPDGLTRSWSITPTFIYKF
ncbi:hypothetical protein F0919_05520 [Taibaiella lutea]|uniref:Uncharacterized protein n=1 Tax=Taibaiella lutea TaxID=2608001 RepID=A0A5M6CPF8_9BACT|nr:hypothetical protein [Taibaiella lutea]KAA5537131.1 hypothetical protein F0919_05520 [Taibaiella lutea]